MDQHVFSAERESAGPHESRLSWASLLLGATSVFCLFNCVTGLPAVWLGVIALREIDRSHGALVGTGRAIGGIFLGLLGTVIAAGGVAVFLVGPALQNAQEAGREAVREMADKQNRADDHARSAIDPCRIHLRQIAEALMVYRDEHRTFPPAFVADAQGRPMHSWRVLILPQLGHQDLYARYRMDEPWDGPYNRELLVDMPGEYGCQSPDGLRAAPGITSVAAVTGSGTLWPGATTVHPGEIGQGDGAAATVLLTECGGANIPWMQPRDVPAAEFAALMQSAPAVNASLGRPRGRYIALADGSAVLVAASTDAAKLTALTTVAGGEGVIVPDASP
jgi:hypothetical protein